MSVLDRVAETLRDPDPGEREWALDRLGALNPPTARGLAIPLLSDPVVGVRESAVTCLGTNRDEEAVADLIRVVHDDPSE